MRVRPTRRHILRGAGVALALPWLESLAPRAARGQGIPLAPKRRFVSMFYGELEPNGVFIYVNAGHPPPFHLAASGEVRFLTEGGSVLGPLLTATYERGFVRLAPGDLVVLYTDGMIEASATPDATPAPGSEYGIDRLVVRARSLAGRPAREIVERLHADVESFCGDAAPQDDRTVVVVNYPVAKA